MGRSSTFGRRTGFVRLTLSVVAVLALALFPEMVQARKGGGGGRGGGQQQQQQQTPPPTAPPPPPSTPTNNPNPPATAPADLPPVAPDTLYPYVVNLNDGRSIICDVIDYGDHYDLVKKAGTISVERAEVKSIVRTGTIATQPSTVPSV